MEESNKRQRTSNLESKVDSILEVMSSIQKDMSTLKQDVNILKQDVDALQIPSDLEETEEQFIAFCEFASKTSFPVYGESQEEHPLVKEAVAVLNSSRSFHPTLTREQLRELLQLQPQWIPLQHEDMPLSLMDPVRNGEGHHVIFRAVHPCLLTLMCRYFRNHERGVVLTGSPGVGKSWFGNLVVWKFISLATAVPSQWRESSGPPQQGKAVIYRSGCHHKTLIFMFNDDGTQRHMQLYGVGAKIPRKVRKGYDCVVIVDLYGRVGNWYQPSGRDGV